MQAQLLIQFRTPNGVENCRGEHTQEENAEIKELSVSLKIIIQIILPKLFVQVQNYQRWIYGFLFGLNQERS